MFENYFCLCLQLYWPKLWNKYNTTCSIVSASLFAKLWRNIIWIIKNVTHHTYRLTQELHILRAALKILLFANQLPRKWHRLGIQKCLFIDFFDATVAWFSFLLHRKHIEPSQFSTYAKLFQVLLKINWIQMVGRMPFLKLKSFSK